MSNSFQELQESNKRPASFGNRFFIWSYETLNDESKRRDKINSYPKIGDDYQAIISESNSEDTLQVGELIWDPYAINPDNVQQYLEDAEKIIGGELNGKELDDVINCLRKNQYDTKVAIDEIIHSPDLFIGTASDDWNEVEEILFDSLIRKEMFGKDFSAIKRAIGTKSVQQIVEYYYWWKCNRRGKRSSRHTTELQLYQRIIQSSDYANNSSQTQNDERSALSDVLKADASVQEEENDSKKRKRDSDQFHSVPTLEDLEHSFSSLPDHHHLPPLLTFPEPPHVEADTTTNPSILHTHEEHLDPESLDKFLL